MLKEMAGEIPGFIASDIVGMDGVSIAAYSLDPKFNAELSCAQYAMVLRLVQKTASQLGAGNVEDNLTTSDKTYILVRYIGDGSYYLGIVVDKANASLGNVRLIARQHTDALWAAIPKRR